MIVYDRITYRLPRAIWWRLHISVTRRRGDFEPGRDPLYRGLVDRWAWRVGPVNVAVLRLR